MARPLRGGQAREAVLPVTSFPDPHHPFTPPGRYWSMYAPDDMVLPASFWPGNRVLARPVIWAMEQRESGKLTPLAKLLSPSTSAKLVKPWR